MYPMDEYILCARYGRPRVDPQHGRGAGPMLAPWSRSSRAAGGWRAVPWGFDGSNQTFGSLVHLSSLEQLQNKHLTKMDERVTRVKDMGESLCVSEGAREDQIAYYPIKGLPRYMISPKHGLCCVSSTAQPDSRVSRQPTAGQLPDPRPRLSKLLLGTPSPDGEVCRVHAARSATEGVC